MRRLAFLLWAGLAIAGCSRDWERFDVNQPDGGGAGGAAGSGGSGLGGSTCFPGSKVCVNDKGQPTCILADVPEYGCSGTTQCDPCNLPNATAACTSGQCAIESCAVDYQNCNLQTVDGCESNKNSDTNHCGNCSIDCIAQHGVNWLCEDGICAVNSCCPSADPSCLALRDCDGNKQNGCEVDVASDAQNCGACGQVCDLAHAQSGCSQSTCVVTACDTGFANCDGNDANGCETNVANDVGNCGGCGNTCSGVNGAAQCMNGSCAITCSPGFGNCNNNANDGCEANLKNDAFHCGKCSTQCNPQNAPSACTNGACDHGTCNAGYGDCDGDKSNGCETNTATSINNCGTCGNKCPVPSSGTAFCANGLCGDNCGSLALCSGNPSYCANTGNDVNNCGACGNKCPNNVPNSSSTCSNSSCGFSCNTGYSKCGTSNTCFDVGSDPTHCGSSCANCPGPSSGSGNATCSAGTCGFTCSSPTPNKCGTKCVDLQADVQNCKTCGTVCAPPANGVTACVAGACSPSCNSSFTLCSGQCFDLQKDKSHCGSCTNSCTDTCCSGKCVDTQNDLNNCGACGNKCVGAQTCKAGSCS